MPSRGLSPQLAGRCTEHDGIIAGSGQRRRLQRRSLQLASVSQFRETGQPSGTLGRGEVVALGLVQVGSARFLFFVLRLLGRVGSVPVGRGEEAGPFGRGQPKWAVPFIFFLFLFLFLSVLIQI